MNYIRSGNTTVTVDEMEGCKIVRNIHASVIGVKDCSRKFIFTTPELKTIQRNKAARENRQSREQVMRDCGLVKVKGALGGTYWE